MIYNLTGFSDVRIFPLFLVRHHYDVIFCHMVFKFAYFMALTKGYQPESLNAVDCLGQVLEEGLQKGNVDVISYSWDSKFTYFVKQIISYQPAKFQTPQLSESNFTKVGIRHPKKPL